MKFKSIKFSVALLAGASAFGASAAEDKGFYAGAGVGQSFVDERHGIAVTREFEFIDLIHASKASGI
mgnify:CR=1 FL=1